MHRCPYIHRRTTPLKTKNSSFSQARSKARQTGRPWRRATSKRRRQGSASPLRAVGCGRLDCPPKSTSGSSVSRRNGNGTTSNVRVGAVASCSGSLKNRTQYRDGRSRKRHGSSWGSCSVSRHPGEADPSMGHRVRCGGLSLVRTQTSQGGIIWNSCSRRTTSRSSAR